MLRSLLVGLAVGLSLVGCEAKIHSDIAPDPNGYFRIALLSNPPDLDPILISDTTSDGVASKVFSQLLCYDENLALVPDLAESWSISTDSLTYTFKLRKGVRFHNGRELVASDVKYSLSRLAEVRSKRFTVIEPIIGAREAQEASKVSGDTPDVSGITTPNDYEVRIQLTKPFVPFKYFLAMTNAAVVPREEVEARGDRFSRQPVGTGPFKLVEWKENSTLKLDRHADYFGGAPKLAGIHYRVIKEPLARQEEYKAGTIDIVDVSPGMYHNWKTSLFADEITEWPQMAVQYYGFNLEKEGSPYAGNTDSARKLRQALNLAIDRDFICNQIHEGRHFPPNGVLPKGVLGYSDRPAFGQDIEKAKQLLVEAGYPGGKGLAKVDLWFNKNAEHDKVAQAVQQDLKGIGVEIDLKQLDWAAYLAAADRGEPAFFRLGWVADYPDADTFLSSLFHSKNKGPQGNQCRYDNSEVDALLNQSFTETDPQRRLELLKKADDIIVADYPWLFITMQKEVILKKPYVKNFRPTGMDDDVACSHVHWHLVELEVTDQQ